MLYIEQNHYNITVATVLSTIDIDEYTLVQKL